MPRALQKCRHAHVSSSISAINLELTVRQVTAWARAAVADQPAALTVKSSCNCHAFSMAAPLAVLSNTHHASSTLGMLRTSVSKRRDVRARHIATSRFWVNRAVESMQRPASPPERLPPAPVADRPRHVRFGSLRVGSPPAARTTWDASARTRPDRRTLRAPGPKIERRGRHQTRRTAATAPGAALVSGPGHQSEPETPSRRHARPAASVHG